MTGRVASHWPEPIPDPTILAAADRAGPDRADAEECLSWVQFEQHLGHRFTMSNVAVARWLDARQLPMPQQAPWEPR